MHSLPSTERGWLTTAATVALLPSTSHQDHVSRAQEVTDRCDPLLRHCGERLSARGAFTVISMLCMAILGGLIGYRVRQIRRKDLEHLCFAHVLICLLYVLSMCFVFAAAVVKSGLGLSSFGICRTAIFLCLSFYVLSKISMYLFLAERAHAIRAPFKRRLHDWLWVIGTGAVITGFGGLGIAAFLNPVTEMSPIDGLCRIGIPRYITIPLVVYDVGINAFLTLTFVYLLGPMIRAGTLPDKTLPATRFAECFSGICERSRRRTGVLVADRGNQHVVRKLEKLIWKTFIGSVLVAIPTVSNVAVLTAVGGRELGWVCLTICTFDVV
ncbi:hypothetical protein C7974DRAFT_217982 [Boeremia exigua]|uniref:uncharacterized protein n=1 Tax=Boeremia exigua TaxID=749465 RepID=UPI001E8D87D7|nr:uncharacterized protein C7974DRAFT_217982 [Boeremia exigua]KAH6622210.1 hypothetical protein C7974DRAFT_217982 [Boeremia exigua]